MKRIAEVIFNLVLWSIIVFLFYSLARTNAHIATGSFRDIGTWHVPYLGIVVFFTVLPSVVSFYIFYLVLVPLFLVRKRIVPFILLATITCVVAGSGYRLTFGGYASQLTSLLFFSILALFWGIMGSAVKGIFLWIDSRAEKKSLEKRNLMSRNALLMLQAQMNPHFLFNSLNNIDILIAENPGTASDYLKKLSEILRYVLYETREQETLLSREITQIENYIDLQKIRSNNPGYVNFRVAGEAGDRKIAPMLFIPFVENAFKHSGNKTITGAIDIELSVEEKKVTFICRNVYDKAKVSVIKNDGLGNDMMRNRLNLLYPGKHTLRIEKDDQYFMVTLVLSF